VQHLIDDIRASLKNECWYSALYLAITLPDICSNRQYGSTDRTKYKKWFNKYVNEKYTHRVGPLGEVVNFLSGSDCYAFRCAVLHEGNNEITGQNARDKIDRFVFISPTYSNIIHCNMSVSGNVSKLQLQVDIFVNDIISGVEKWMKDMEAEDKKNCVSLPLKINNGSGIVF